MSNIAVHITLNVLTGFAIETSVHPLQIQACLCSLRKWIGVANVQVLTWVALLFFVCMYGCPILITFCAWDRRGQISSIQPCEFMCKLLLVFNDCPLLITFCAWNRRGQVSSIQPCSSRVGCLLVHRHMFCVAIQFDILVVEQDLIFLVQRFFVSRGKLWPPAWSHTYTKRKASSADRKAH